MPKRDNFLLLEDIYEAGAKILRFTDGYSFDAYISDERTVDAVLRNFEVIGEASRMLSKPFMEAHTDVEWKKMIGFRNLIIHEYFGINHNIVWAAIQNYLPQTLKEIQKILTKRQT